MSRARDVLNKNARESVDRELGSAASALERAANAIQELQQNGITYEIPGSGDGLTYVQTLSRSVLDLQVDVRKANHEA